RMLLHALGDYALTQGISSFLAEVLAENYRMIAFCERAGYPLSIKREGYTLHIWMSLRPSETIRAATASGAAHQE
ncbi:MAG TPA: hypothetical protein VER55_01095, partial [Ardenticatenaceae bacterium]|nr:hypothetical protein [Ardenticatenaceae bacterium]